MKLTIFFISFPLLDFGQKQINSVYLQTFDVGVASFEIASIVSNVCQFVPKLQQRILQFDTHLPRDGIPE